MHELCIKRDMLKQEFNRIMRANLLDVLLTPVNVHAATKATNIQQLGSLSYYNFLANLCDLPAGVLPVTSV